MCVFIILKGDINMKFIDQLKERAKQNRKKIVLPETSDMRTIEAAGKVLAEGIADVILVGDKNEIIDRAGDIDLSGASFVDPKTYDKFDEYVDCLLYTSPSPRDA